MDYSKRSLSFLKARLAKLDVTADAAEITEINAAITAQQAARTAETATMTGHQGELPAPSRLATLIGYTTEEGVNTLVAMLNDGSRIVRILTDAQASKITDRTQGSDLLVSMRKTIKNVTGYVKDGTFVFHKGIEGDADGTEYETADFFESISEKLAEKLASKGVK